MDTPDSSLNYSLSWALRAKPPENALQQSLEIYSHKVISSLIAQKHKYDTCIHWLLIINLGILSAIGIGSFDGQRFVYLCALGILLTWLILLRSSRAYMMLHNYDYLMTCIHIHLTNSNMLPRHELEARIRQYDYFLGDTTFKRKYIKTESAAIIKALKSEYGVVFFLYGIALTICHSHILIPPVEIVSVLMATLIIMLAAFLLMFHSS